MFALVLLILRLQWRLINPPPPPEKKTRVQSKPVETFTEKLICIVSIPGLMYGPLLCMSSIMSRVDADITLAKLKEIKIKRLSQPVKTVHRMMGSCDLIPETLSHNHGYYCICYQRFTLNLNRLNKSYDPMEELPTTSRATRASSTEGASILFKPDCIFCKSGGRKKF